MYTTTSSNKSPLKFFLLVFALAIPLWVIGTVVKVKGLPLDVPVTDFIGAFIPLIAACILVYKEEGHGGVKKLLKRIFDFSKIRQKIWYLPLIFLMPIIYLLIYGVMHLFRLPLPIGVEIPFLKNVVMSVAFFLLATGEEVGWSGYAVDALQERWSALTTAIIVGLVWAILHYPSMIQQGRDLRWVVWGTLGTVCLRILIVWLYNNTGKSVSACILFHSMANIGRILFPKDQNYNPLFDYPDVHYSIIAIAAVIVIFLWGSKTLARYKYRYT
ncbi:MULTISPECIES: type II CAAX endopeptidase family protein [unclassified Microcoleus]|uniref:type II CAAX endopeptidase family protein n=1 Tax=unclassified Microcoleus TaxID=2642155 RepID=UPI002FD6E4A8